MNKNNTWNKLYTQLNLGKDQKIIGFHVFTKTFSYDFYEKNDNFSGWYFTSNNDVEIFCL